MTADYTEDFPCKCGGNLDVYIDWNNGDETMFCENRCEFSETAGFLDWFCETKNKNNGGDEQ